MHWLVFPPVFLLLSLFVFLSERRYRLITHQEFNQLRERLAAHTGLRLQQVSVDDTRYFTVSGLLNVEIRHETWLPQTQRQRDLKVGQECFDEAIFWRVHGGLGDAHHRNADFRSRLDAETRRKIIHLVQHRGIRFNDGKLIIPGKASRSAMADPIARDAFQSDRRQASTLQATLSHGSVIGRLTGLVLTDPVMPFRLSSSRHCSPFSPTIGHDDAPYWHSSSPVTLARRSPRTAPSKPLSMRPISALAAIRSLREHGTRRPCDLWPTP